MKNVMAKANRTFSKRVNFPLWIRLFRREEGRRLSWWSLPPPGPSCSSCRRGSLSVLIKSNKIQERKIRVFVYASQCVKKELIMMMFIGYKHTLVLWNGRLHSQLCNIYIWRQIYCIPMSWLCIMEIKLVIQVWLLVYTCSIETLVRLDDGKFGRLCDALRPFACCCM